jgi:hypothetical protein
MVDWADELGIDLAALHLEAFWHPVAQWENARISEKGDLYWAWYRQAHPEPPTTVARFEAKPRPRFDFTERQMEIAMRSVNAGV